MDVDEATTEAVEDMRRLREELPEDGALVVLARNGDDEGVYRAVVGGAAGHVGEDAQPEELVDTIKQAAHGEEPISKTLADRPEVGRRVLETYAELSANNTSRHPAKMTERELNILSLAAQGQTNQQIGKYLGVSEHTVKSSISLILARLGMRHRTEAVVHALRNGWITMPSMTENPAVGDCRRPVYSAWFLGAASLSRPATSGEEVHAEHHDHGANYGDDDRVDVDDVTAACRAGAQPRDERHEETADERADDTEHDVADYAPALITLNEQPGDVTGNRTEHNPGNDVDEHSIPPCMFASQRAFGRCCARSDPSYAHVGRIVACGFVTHRRG